MTDLSVRRSPACLSTRICSPTPGRSGSRGEGGSLVVLADVALELFDAVEPVQDKALDLAEDALFAGWEGGGRGNRRTFGPRQYQKPCPGSDAQKRRLMGFAGRRHANRNCRPAPVCKRNDPEALRPTRCLHSLFQSSCLLLSGTSLTHHRGTPFPPGHGALPKVLRQPFLEDLAPPSPPGVI